MEPVVTSDLLGRRLRHAHDRGVAGGERLGAPTAPATAEVLTPQAAREHRPESSRPACRERRGSAEPRGESPSRRLPLETIRSAPASMGLAANPARERERSQPGTVSPQRWLPIAATRYSRSPPGPPALRRAGRTSARLRPRIQGGWVTRSRRGVRQHGGQVACPSRSREDSGSARATARQSRHGRTDGLSSRSCPPGRRTRKARDLGMQ